MSKLVHNIAALGSVQVIGYLIPLITLPYLTRVLGPEGWGTVAFVQLIIGYFTLVTNWGFSFSGTRKVAEHRNNTAELSKIFSSIWGAQWLLVAIGIITLLILVRLNQFFASNKDYFFYGIGVIVSSVLFPAWFLSGLEKIKQVALIQFFSRLIAVPFILIFVKSPSDGSLVIAITAFTALIGGGMSLLWMRLNLNLFWHIPKLSDIKKELIQGGVLFGSTVSYNLYSSTTPVVLGMIAGSAAVGHYVLADKIRQLAQSALAPIMQSLFPRMSNLFSSDINKAKSLIYKASKFIIILALFESLVIFTFANPIVALISGAAFKDAVPLLMCMAPLPLIVSLSNIFGTQILIPMKMNTVFVGVMGTAAVISLSMIFPLVHWQGALGAAINTLLIEVFVTVSMAMVLWKLNFFKTK